MGFEGRIALEQEAQKRYGLSDENSNCFIAMLLDDNPQMEDAMDDIEKGMPLGELREKYPHFAGITDEMIQESES